MPNPLISALNSGITSLSKLTDNPNIDYEQIVIYGSWLITAFEIYLIRRQLKQYDRTEIPTKLIGHLEKDTFTKAQAYGRDKTRFELVKKVFDQVLAVVTIRSRVFLRVWNLTGGWMRGFGLGENRVITHSLFWVATYTIVSTIIGLPWDYYHTFVLEEKHGFNKSTIKLWVMDKVKGLGLMMVLGLPLMAAFAWVVEWGGKEFIPWSMLFLIVLQLSLQIIYPTFIQPLFNKLTPLPAGDLRTGVEALAGKLGFPLKHLYVIDGSKRSSHSNAYFYGLPWSKHIVIYDTLIEQSSADEVNAVLAHELGHWYLSHPSKLLLIGNSHILFYPTAFAIFIHNKSLYQSFGFDPRMATSSRLTGPSAVLIGFNLFQLVLEPLDTPVKFLMNALTRKYEYQADEFGVLLNKKEDLKNALIKLHVKNLSSPHSDALYSMYHHSHPTLPERLSAMDNFDTRGKELKLNDEKKEL